METAKESISSFVYQRRGVCPICEGRVVFKATNSWLRDHLHCPGCHSIPRERALALVLFKEFSDWANLTIHESSPLNRGISLRLAKECDNYVATHFFPDEKLGTETKGYRNEDLENQTFDSNVFDLVVSLDVMEHVNRPDRCFQEIERTLRPGGAYVFTTPTFKGKLQSQRRAKFLSNSEIEFFFPPEYHDNPVDGKGSLVTFHFGYDLPELIYSWSGMDTVVLRFQDHYHGIIGEFTEVYISCKR